MIESTSNKETAFKETETSVTAQRHSLTNLSGNIDLSCSVVISIFANTNQLSIELDVLTEPGHPCYQAPKPPEIACYRPGKLVFPNLRRVISRETRLNVYPPDSNTGAADMGELHSVKPEDGEYILCADFGVLRIRSDEPYLDVS
ncbi:MAG: hypothetical protein HY986_04590 [Candidatus Melainabacteria bacterium]|nr:hypothetical protein [Candidatus Melainabacteria bacterium]